jgi:autotransporter-associated beta strand protein
LGGGTYAGPITINTGATFKYNSDANQTFSSGGAGGALRGAGSFIKDGAGTLTVSENGGPDPTANLFTGPVTINQGTLKMAGEYAFWNNASTYSIASGAVLELSGPSWVPVGTTTLNGAGTLRIAGGTLNVDRGGANLVVSLGSGGLIDVQTGGGIVNNWHAMNWTSNLADLNVNGTFDVYDGHDVFVDALTGTGTVTRGHSKAPGDPPVSTLTVGVDNGSGTFSGKITHVSMPLELVKTGSGTQTLTGVNTYQGATIVNAGTLALSGAGDINSTSGITVNGPTAVFMQNSSVASTRTFTLTRGTLGGTGTINTAITSGANATIAPGNRTLTVPEKGVLTIANAVNLAGGTTGGTTEMRLFSTTANDSDMLASTAGLTYGGILEVTTVGSLAFAIGNHWDLFDFGSESGTFSNDSEFGTLGGTYLPHLTAGKKWNFDYDRGVLSVVLGVVPGDTNSDNVVDAFDFITLKKNFGKSGGVAQGDFNSSGTVNWADLGILMSNMGTGGGAPATTPEPATLCLLAIGALAMLRRRK